MDIHLLNVQPPFSRHVTRFVDRGAVKEAHHEASKETPKLSKRMLDEAGAAYTVHHAVGEKTALIAAVAQQLCCDHIVMGTALASGTTISRFERPASRQDIYRISKALVEQFIAGFASPPQRTISSTS